MMGIADRAREPWGCSRSVSIRPRRRPMTGRRAAEKLNQQKPLVRSYYDQDYIKALKNEDIWISMVWSGDVFQAAALPGL